MPCQLRLTHQGRVGDALLAGNRVVVAARHAVQLVPGVPTGTQSLKGAGRLGHPHTTALTSLGLDRSESRVAWDVVPALCRRSTTTTTTRRNRRLGLGKLALGNRLFDRHFLFNN